MKQYVFSCERYEVDSYIWDVTVKWSDEDAVMVTGRAAKAEDAVTRALEVAYERTSNVIPPDRVEAQMRGL